MYPRNSSAMNYQYPETRNGLLRSASTSLTVTNFDQPLAPPRRRKRGQSLSSNKLSSANSSQYSLIMNYAYTEMDPNLINNEAFQQKNWNHNSTSDRYISPDSSKGFLSSYKNQEKKSTGVLDQIINRVIPTPPPRISSTRNTLRRRSLMEEMMKNNTKGINRKNLYTGLNQSLQQFDIPGTPVTTHLPPNSPRIVQSNANFSNSHLNLNSNRAQQLNLPSQTNTYNQNYFSKTMSLDNLNLSAFKQTLRKSPTREELFNFIVSQQEQLAELKTQQKVLEKQVDIAHKEASKAHHHHHRHKHHRPKKSKNDNLDNSFETSSFVSSEKRSKKYNTSKSNKDITLEANKHIHDHIRQLQEQLELIRKKRMKIKKNETIPEIDQENELLKNKNEENNQKKNSSLNIQKSNKDFGKIEMNNLISSTPDSRSSSAEKALIRKELLKETAKEKWNRSFMEDLVDEQIIKELNQNSDADFLKKILPKISINSDNQKEQTKMNYNEILEKNLKLHQGTNWLTDALDDYTFSEKMPNEPLSPFGGRTGIFRPISTDSSVSTPKEKLEFYRENLESPLINLNDEKIDFKNEENELVQKLENELMFEKQRQVEIINKKNEIEQKQIEHELELEKTKNQLFEQQNLFKEQQQLFQNQKKEIELERWRLEQEKNQLLHQHQMAIKQEQLQQQQILNEQLEQQRRVFEQQLKHQQQQQQNFQKELEHQKQLQNLQHQKIHNLQQQKLQSLITQSTQMNPIMEKNLEPKNFPMNEPTKTKRHRLVQDDHHPFNVFKPPLHNSKSNIMESPKNSFNAINYMSENRPSSPIPTSFIKNSQNLLTKSSLMMNNRPLSPNNSYVLENRPLSPKSTNRIENRPLSPNSSYMLENRPLSPKSTRMIENRPLSPISSFMNGNQSLLSNSRMNENNQILKNLYMQENRPLSPNSTYNTNNNPLSSHSSYLMNNRPLSPQQAHAIDNNLQNSFFKKENRPLTPKPSFNNNSGLMSSTSSLTRTQPVGGLINQNNLSIENFSKNNQNFFGSSEFESYKNGNKQYFGSGSNLSKNDLTAKNLSTGSLHSKSKNFPNSLQQPSDPYLMKPRSFSDRLNETDKFSNHKNINNSDRRNSVMDPFRDHFDQYFAPKKHSSNLNLKTNTDNSLLINKNHNKNLMQNEFLHKEKPLNLMNLEKLNQDNIFKNPSDSLEQTHYLDKLNKDNTIESQGVGNRRLTLPELPRATDTTSEELLKGYSISKPKTNQTKVDSVVRRKNSLPDNVKSATVVAPGWNREEISHLAHEAREAKAKAAEMNSTQLTFIKIKNWLQSNLFVLCLIIFNLSILYVYLQILQPFDK